MTMDMDAPLDFEFEDPLISPLPTPKRRKAIELDKLLQEHYAQQSRIIEKKLTRENERRSSKSDDEEEEVDATESKKEALLSNFVVECTKQVQAIKTENETAMWGFRVFEDQKPPPSLVCPQLGSCSLLQPAMDNELSSVLELSPETGESFSEELLINGWVTELVFTCGHVEEPVATWIFYLMLYSTNEDLRTAACNFWCSVISQNNEDGIGSIRIDGFPSYSDLKEALEVYGYLPDSSKAFSSLPETNNSCSDEPHQNIRLWIKFVAVCCQARSTAPIFSNHSELEELLGVIITFSLDRRLQGLSLLLHECVLSLINSFTDNEWRISCPRVAESLAFRVQKNFNCLKLVESISGVDARSKQLRRELAFQALLKLSNTKVSDGEDILRWLISINVKGEQCQFFPMYIDLVLTEHWLFSNPLLEEKPLILEMWGYYLRNYSCQISSTDMRPYASKVRNKASYLLQSADQRKSDY